MGHHVDGIGAPVARDSSALMKQVFQLTVFDDGTWKIAPNDEPEAMEILTQIVNSLEVGIPIQVDLEQIRRNPK
jgi:hypothetical protein